MTSGLIRAASALAGRSAPPPADRNALALALHRVSRRRPAPLRRNVRPG